PQFPLDTGQMLPYLVRLTIMTLDGSTSDWAWASRADVEYPSMARRNRAEVVVADEVGVYHCVQRVVRRAFLCGVDRLSGNSYEQKLNSGPPGVAGRALRLQVSAESWLETIARFGGRFHRALGLSDHLKVEARRLGVNRLHGLR